MLYSDSAEGLMENPHQSGLAPHKAVQQGKHEKGASLLKRLLKKIFFEPCPFHPIRRNEMNKYCINCDLPVCQYCLTSGIHRQHKTLKIYRHVYKDVVALSAMEKYIDCDKIQPYKSNKRLVIALTPLPHCGSTFNSRISCKTCKRRLSEPETYRYCSVTCKFTSSLKKSKELGCGSSVSIESPPMESQSKAGSSIRTLNRRKTEPRRAPFF